MLIIAPTLIPLRKATSLKRKKCEIKLSLFSSLQTKAAVSFTFLKTRTQCSFLSFHKEAVSRIRCFFFKRRRVGEKETLYKRKQNNANEKRIESKFKFKSY